LICTVCDKGVVVIPRLECELHTLLSIDGREEGYGFACRVESALGWSLLLSKASKAEVWICR
jgi:hypothetical protein